MMVTMLRSWLNVRKKMMSVFTAVSSTGCMTAMIINGMGYRSPPVCLYGAT